MRAGLITLLLGCSLLVAACAPRSATSPAPSDALVTAASRQTTAGPVAIEGYVIDFIGRRVSDLDFLEVVATKDGRVLVEQQDMFTNAGMMAAIHEPPARLQPETKAERVAREGAVEAGTKTVWRENERAFKTIRPRIRMYLVRDREGRQYYVAPDGVEMYPAPKLIAWPPPGPDR